MRREDVEDTLRRHLRQEPFQPFVIDLADGRRLEIDERCVVMGGGGATWWTPDYLFEEFQFDDVIDIRSPTPGDRLMTAETFDLTLRRLLRQEPFQPFVVELVDGRRLEIDRPRLAVNYGGATLVTPDLELIEFVPEEVREIRLAEQGAGT